jgi:hypothetical protein
MLIEIMIVHSDRRGGEIIPVFVTNPKNQPSERFRGISKATPTIKETRAHQATMRHSAPAFRNNGGACSFSLFADAMMM